MSPPAAPSLPARLWRWTKRLLVAGLVGLLLAVLAVGAGYAYYSRDLPSVEALRRYRPPQVTKVFCTTTDAAGRPQRVLCAEYFQPEGRRTLIRLAELPPHVKNAFLAAEDAEFYQHPGLDWVGMARAGVKNLIPGSRKSGASTITQQVVKNLLLSPERSFTRKAREWILTPRVEEALSKDQILELYVNQVYFGKGRHGLEEAALYYFGKRAKDLSLGEATVLAGTVQSPHRINPVTNVVRAKARQQYVLKQMAEHGFAAPAAVAAERDKPIALAPPPPAPVGLYYAEEIRQQLLARYGEAKVLQGGLQVDIAMDPRLQAAAETSVRAALEAVDRRQGYRGPAGALEPARFTALRALVAQRMEEAGKRQSQAEYVADLAPLAAAAGPETPAPAQSPLATPEEGSEERPDEAAPGEAPPSADLALARAVALRPLAQGMSLVGWVSQVDDAGKRARVDLVGRAGELSFASATWARRPKGTAPRRMSDVVKVGELVRVRVTKAAPAPALLEVALDQVPAVQGALVAVRPGDRHVVALVGGYDFARSSFNRATQAKRQPGSTFKPFLYAAAMASGRYTPLSLVNDAPEAIRDPYTGKQWKPQNYDRSFDGPMTLRAALTRSKNTVSVRLIEALTPATVIEFARRAGISSPLPENLTLSLGTGEVTVLEAANAYATLQGLGRYAEPLMLLRVVDADGTVLEQHEPSFEERLPPAAAYLATSLMQSVVEEGTAREVLSLNRPAAGKTGTTSEHRDTWFSGYTQDWVASAWVGFDDNTPLGPSETGGRAALPMWLDFMRVAHEGLPPSDFPVPPGVVRVRVDPATGLLAGSAIPGRLEPFLEGTQPTAEAPPPGTVGTDSFFLEDGKRSGRL